jgi:hypothetical protein
MRNFSVNLFIVFFICFVANNLSAYPLNGRTIESQALVDAAFSGNYYLAKDIFDNYGDTIDLKKDFNGALIIGAIIGLNKYISWNFVSPDAIALVTLFLDKGVNASSWDVWQEFPLVWNPEIETLAEKLHAASPIGSWNSFPYQIAKRSYNAAKWLQSKGYNVELPPKETEIQDAWIDKLYEKMKDRTLLANLNKEGKIYCLSLSQIRKRIDKKQFSAGGKLYEFYKNFSGSFGTLKDIKYLLVQAGDKRVITKLLEDYDMYGHNNYENLTLKYLIRNVDSSVFNVIENISDFQNNNTNYSAKLSDFAKLLAPYYEGKENITARCINSLADKSFPMLLAVAKDNPVFKKQAAELPVWEETLRFGEGVARFNAVYTLALFDAGQKLLEDYLFQTTNAKLFLLIDSKITLPATDKTHTQLKEAFEKWIKRKYSQEQYNTVNRIVELLFLTKYSDTATIMKSDENFQFYNKNGIFICEKIIEKEGLEKALDIFAEYPPVTNIEYYQENFPGIFK